MADTKSLLERLSAVQTALKVPKAQENIFGHYKYRNAEDILEAVKPLLFELKLTLVLSDQLEQIGERYYIKAIASLADESGSLEVYGYAREEETKKGMDGSQITGASSSYARKYALNGLFLIDDTKDSDSTNEHDKAPATSKPAYPSKKVEATVVPASTPGLINPQSMERLKTLMRELDYTGRAATDFVQDIINKEAPSNEAEVQTLISALSTDQDINLEDNPLA